MYNFSMHLVSPHWHQEQEQQKNQRPHDKKYTTHPKERKTAQPQRHIQEEERYIKLKTNNNSICE
jgi:hypothetical protein